MVSATAVKRAVDAKNASHSRNAVDGVSGERREASNRYAHDAAGSSVDGVCCDFDAGACRRSS